MLLLGDSILEYSYTHEGRNILVIGACFKPKSPFKAGDYFRPLSVSNIFFFSLTGKIAKREIKAGTHFWETEMSPQSFPEREIGVWGPFLLPLSCPLSPSEVFSRDFFKFGNHDGSI